MSKRSQAIGACGWAIATCLVAQSAAAQDSEPSAPAREESDAQAEIVVTAQRRSERLIEVPQSVTVLSGDTLAEQGATQLRDFAATVPGLSFQTEGAGLTQITLRGVTVGKDVGSTVAIYVDDVPYGSTSPYARGGQVSLDVGLFDIDQIEVLRGPQGTLYGASTMGGLIKYRMAPPTADQLGVRARAGLSTTRSGGTNYDASLTANVPLSPQVALRASAFQSHDGGYIDNTRLGLEDVNRADIYGGRLELQFNPTEDLSIRLTGFAQNVSRDGFPYSEFTRLGSVNGLLNQQRSVPESFDQSFRLASASVSYDIGGAEIVSVSSFQTVRTSFITDLPSFVSLCPCSSVASTDDTGTDKFTQELRLASQGNRRLTWQIGGFYTHERSTNEATLILTGTSGQSLPNNLFTFSQPSTYEEIAGFGNLTFQITPEFDVSAGLRYSHTKQAFRQIGTGSFGASLPLTASSDDVVTYLANARYRFTSHVTAYARFATGYRPGGPNPLIVNSSGQPLGPPQYESDTLKSYELGLKAETSDRRFGFDLSAYHIDWSNILVTTTINGFGARINAPDGANIDGGELSLFARPNNDLSLTGSLSYQNARLAGPITRPAASRGDPLPSVPRWNASLTGDYVISQSDFRPRVGATLAYVGERPASFGAVRYTLPSYTTIDLRAGFDLSPVSIQFYIRNLTDTRAQLTPRVLGSDSTASTTNPFLVTILQPRTIGVALSAEF